MNKTTRPIRSTLSILCCACSLLLITSAGCSLRQAIIDGVMTGISDTVATTLSDALGAGDTDE